MSGHSGPGRKRTGPWPNHRDRWRAMPGWGKSGDGGGLRALWTEWRDRAVWPKIGKFKEIDQRPQRADRGPIVSGSAAAPNAAEHRAAVAVPWRVLGRTTH